jgi:hypothetical protein
MRRTGGKLRRGNGKIRDAERKTWCSYEAFPDMYDSVYTAMVDGGGCTHLQQPVVVDK